MSLTKVSLEEKTNVLKHKLKFKSDNNPDDVHKIFVSPDLTPLEQKKNNDLRRQLSEMNKVQNIYTIRNGQIVHKNKIHSSDQQTPDLENGSS